jgi:hypothetical protein
MFFLYSNHRLLRRAGAMLVRDMGCLFSRLCGLLARRACFTLSLKIWTFTSNAPAFQDARALIIDADLPALEDCRYLRASKAWR